jgi:antitoxin Phd
MAISDARDQLSDVVNRAAFGGQKTYITRRGRRLAVVASPDQIAADQAEAARLGVLRVARQALEELEEYPEAIRDALRDTIARAIELAEDSNDLTLYNLSVSNEEGGVEPEPWEKVKAELGL